MKISKLVLLFILLMGSTYFGQENYSNPDSVTEISLEINEEFKFNLLYSFGYLYGFNYTLELLSNQHPQLKQRCENINQFINENYDYPLILVDSILAEIIDGWDSVKQVIKDKSDKILVLDGIEYDAADMVVTDAEDILVEGLSDTVACTVLSIMPEYLNNPEREFDDGFYADYTIPDSSGNILKIVTPQSWDFTESPDENVMLVRSQFGNGRASFALRQISLLPDIVVDESFITEMMEDSSEFSGNTKLISQRTEIINGYPGYSTEFKAYADVNNNQYFTHLLRYNIFVENELFVIVFFCTSEGLDEKTNDAHFSIYHELFKRIAESFELVKTE